VSQCADRRSRADFALLGGAANGRDHEKRTALENSVVAVDVHAARRIFCWGLAQRRCVLPNVRANRHAAAGGDWPRKDNLHYGLERPGDDCRSVSG